MKHKSVLSLVCLFITGAVMAQEPPARKSLTKADAAVFNGAETEYLQVQKELQQLEQQKKQLLAMMQSFNEQQKNLTSRVEKLEKRYTTLNATTAAAGSSQSSLLNATQQMQETQMAFNLQYLQLQTQMQNENRSYIAVSNIMKTKHDTVKNSISNIR